MTQQKLVVATTSLAGCFGCHMSFLDLDEKILDVVELIEFHKSPFDDIKEFTQSCDIGFVEGGCCNTDNVRILRDFRAQCRVLISVGQCAITGGLPAMRNGIPLSELFKESYLSGPTTHNQLIPNDEEIPAILDRVYPCHEIVKVDAFLPGCPPHPELFLEAILAVREGRPLDQFNYQHFKYD